ncbi:lycopene cyclase domain-containing protein [Corallococcus sp. H22C18031201]|nr:lycopene cyclase domain-containing protein [Corallococcus sp. H22C18031201]
MMSTRWAYLVHLLGWGLPVIGLQMFFLWRHHGTRTRGVLRAVLPPALGVGLYLSVADHLAISTGLWRFGEGRHQGVYVGAVPLEEVLFFVLTSTLVSLGVALFAALTRGEARAT